MDVVVQTSLVDMYAMNGHLKLACYVFKNMPCKNVISWGALISGFDQNGFAGNALDLLVEMQGCGYRPDLVYLVSALLACTQVGFLKLGKSIHGYIVRRLDFDRVLGTAVIDMYSKCGALSWARTLFDQINCKGFNLLECNDNQLWNSWAWKRSSVSLPRDDKNKSKTRSCYFFFPSLGLQSLRSCGRRSILV